MRPKSDTRIVPILHIVTPPKECWLLFWLGIVLMKRRHCGWLDVPRRRLADPSVAVFVQSSQGEIKLPKARKQVLVDAHVIRSRFNRAIAGRQRVLCLLDRLERAGREKGESRRAETRGVGNGNENGFAEDARVDAIERVIAPWNPAAMNHSLHSNTVLG